MGIGMGVMGALYSMQVRLQHMQTCPKQSRFLSWVLVSTQHSEDEANT